MELGLHIYIVLKRGRRRLLRLLGLGGSLLPLPLLFFFFFFHKLT